MKKDRAVFSSEAMLCLTFLRGLPEGWTAYPETAGFDIVLRRDVDDVQVAIEAKLTLNAKVLSQIVEERRPGVATSPGPDFRAVLIPWGCAGDLSYIASLLGITVIQQHSKETFEQHRRYYTRPPRFRPELPNTEGRYYWMHEDWIDWAPTKRLQLPDYVPDVAAGRSAPVQLSDWKIRAIKLVIILQRRGYVTRQDFDDLKLSHHRWTSRDGYLARGAEKGQYVAHDYTPTFKQQHPKNFAEIEADYENWVPKPPAVSPP